VIDYIRLTVKFPASVGDCPNSMADYAYAIARDVHTTGEIVSLSRGSYGYTNGFSVCGSGRVMWGEARMGVCIELPGTALSTWVASNDGADSLSLLGYLLAFRINARITRIDCALDTFDIHIHTFRDAARSGQIVTPGKTVRYLESFSDAGDTLYVGSRTSDRMLRVYNKSVEQGSDLPIWTRVELEIKGELANLAAMSLIDGKVSIQDLIVSFCDFRLLDATRTNNRTRCSWWASFLGDCSRVVLLSKTALHDTLEKKLAWIQRSIAPTLALVSMIMGSTDWMKFEVQHALDRISPKDLALIT